MGFYLILISIIKLQDHFFREAFFDKRYASAQVASFSLQKASILPPGGPYFMKKLRRFSERTRS